jgi:hypothetical protein
MDIFTLAIYPVSYLLISLRNGSLLQTRKMRQASTPRRTPIAILMLCSDTEKSGEAYDIDVQTLSWPRKDDLS